MESLESELQRARALSVADLADAIESIGFECTRCGACCKAETCGEGADSGDDEDGTDPHTATVFPDEIRTIAGDDYDFRDVARPMPYGLSEGENGLEGETFEWALQTDDCGDCTFYEETETDDGTRGPVRSTTTARWSVGPTRSASRWVGPASRWAKRSTAKGWSAPTSARGWAGTSRGPPRLRRPTFSASHCNLWSPGRRSRRPRVRRYSCGVTPGGRTGESGVSRGHMWCIRGVGCRLLTVYARCAYSALGGAPGWV